MPVDGGVRARTWFALRLALGALVALWLATLAHHLVRVYAEPIAALLWSRWMRTAAAAAILAALFYGALLLRPARARPGPKATAMALVWGVLIALWYTLSGDEAGSTRESIERLRATVGNHGLLTLGCLYALALAVPFVPGMELGLLMMLIFGTPGTVAAYLATLAGLSLAFLVGRCVPASIGRAWLARLGRRAATPSADAAMREMVATPGTRARSGLLASLLAYRYLLLAMSLNIPGNSIIGGGGGIALLCGISGRFHWSGFALTVALATLPVPLLILTGVLDLQTVFDGRGLLHEVLDRLEHMIFGA